MVDAVVLRGHGSDHARSSPACVFPRGEHETSQCFSHLHDDIFYNLGDYTMTGGAVALIMTFSH
jgi:hypothetical protein